jgi:hypothetical protein
MKASDVMVSNVITVGPDASIQDCCGSAPAQSNQRRAGGGR